MIRRACRRFRARRATTPAPATVRSTASAAARRAPLAPSPVSARGRPLFTAAAVSTGTGLACTWLACAPFSSARTASRRAPSAPAEAACPRARSARAPAPLRGSRAGSSLRGARTSGRARPFARVREADVASGGALDAPAVLRTAALVDGRGGAAGSASLAAAAGAGSGGAGSGSAGAAGTGAGGAAAGPLPRGGRYRSGST
jgi:hypothetical protein